MKNQIHIMNNIPHPPGLDEWKLQAYLVALVTALNTSWWGNGSETFAPYTPVDINRRGQLRILVVPKCNDDYPQFEERAKSKYWPGNLIDSPDKFADGRLQGFMEGFAVAYREENKPTRVR
jgi:hypothetical protein